MISGENIIAGNFSVSGTNCFQTKNPVINTSNPTIFVDSTTEELDEAVSEATKAFASYSKTDCEKRSSFLEEIAKSIEDHAAQIIEIYCQESGYLAGRAQSELGRTTAQLRSFSALVKTDEWRELVIDTGIPERTPLPKPDIRKMLHAIGPVVVFGASNFPLAFSTAGGDTASALAAGCPVIVKSHPLHAGTSEFIARLITNVAAALHLHPGVFSHVNGISHEVGSYLVTHPAIKAVGFTGSFRGGNALLELAQQRKQPIPVYAEMGSTNPIVILPQQLKEQAEEWAQKIADSVLLGSGQFCTNPGIIIGMEGAELDRFATTISRLLASQDYLCMLGDSIAETYVNGVHLRVNHPSLEGAIIADTQLIRKQNHVKPFFATVKAEQFIEKTFLHEELFGPSTLLVQCKNEEELSAVIRSLEGQLTGTIIGNRDDLTVYSAIIDELAGKTGRMLFNGVPTGVEVCPAMHHGGPFPASSGAFFTSVGTDAIKRWGRPIAWQNCPQEQLPVPLRNENPQQNIRKINGQFTRDSL